MPAPKRKRILIVEDTVSGQMLIKRWIINAGYDTEIASDGNQALTMAKANAPDLILLDVVMPELNGYAVCRKLRDIEETKKTPILITTGLHSSSDADDAKLSGANEVIVKPVEREALIKKIQQYLGAGLA